jgi:hypothetical protein
MKTNLSGRGRYQENGIAILVLWLCFLAFPVEANADNTEYNATGPILTFGLGYSKSLMEDHPKGSYCLHLSLSRLITKGFALGIESGFYGLGQQRIGYIEDDFYGDLRVYERRDLIPLTLEIYRVSHIKKLGTLRASLGLGGYFLGREVKFGNSEPDLGLAWPDENCFGGSLGADLYFGHLSQELSFGSGIRFHWFSMRDGKMPVVTIFAELHWQ